jgi:predicted small metal-binding protein
MLIISQQSVSSTTPVALLAHLNPDHTGGKLMAKILECAKVDPSSGCQHVVRGETEEEVLTQAAEHAKEYGIRDVTPELMARVKANIRDAQPRCDSPPRVHASPSPPRGARVGPAEKPPGPPQRLREPRRP